MICLRTPGYRTRSSPTPPPLAQSRLRQVDLSGRRLPRLLLKGGQGKEDVLTVPLGREQHPKRASLPTCPNLVDVAANVAGAPLPFLSDKRHGRSHCQTIVGLERRQEFPDGLRSADRPVVPPPASRHQPSVPSRAEPKVSATAWSAMSMAWA